MAGYPIRGNPILGVVVTNNESGMSEDGPYLALDKLPYTTMGYANGPGAVINGSRSDPTNSTGKTFLQQSLVPLTTETHGGQDVAVYAQGPRSHLVRGVIEQNVIFFLMANALNVFERQASPSSKPFGGNELVAVVVGGSAALILIIALTVLLCRRRRARFDEQAPLLQPSTAHRAAATNV